MQCGTRIIFFYTTKKININQPTWLSLATGGAHHERKIKIREMPSRRRARRTRRINLLHTLKNKHQPTDTWLSLDTGGAHGWAPLCPAARRTILPRRCNYISHGRYRVAYESRCDERTESCVKSVSISCWCAPRHRTTYTWRRTRFTRREHARTG